MRSETPVTLNLDDVVPAENPKIDAEKQIADVLAVQSDL